MSCIYCRSPYHQPTSYRPRLLLSGERGSGQTSHLAPALLHTLERFSVHRLDLPALYSVSAKTPEESCAQVGLYHVRVRCFYLVLYIQSKVVIDKVFSKSDNVNINFYWLFISILILVQKILACVSFKNCAHCFLFTILSSCKFNAVSLNTAERVRLPLPPRHPLVKAVVSEPFQISQKDILESNHRKENDIQFEMLGLYINMDQ